MKDRVPLYPGRVKLAPVPGQENIYDMTRADQPTEVGTPLNKNTFLSDETAWLYGLDDTAVPDDLFQRIIFNISGKSHALNITAKMYTGDPAVGVTLGGVTALDGGPIVTDAYGKAVGYVDSLPATITTPDLGYLDVGNASVEVGTSENLVIPVEVVIPAVSNKYVKIQSSQKVKFSRGVSTVDVCIVGGGGGGGAETTRGRGGGGGGGYVTNAKGVSITPNQEYDIVIGAGGSGGKRDGASATDGGASSAFGHTANGGKKGLGGTGGAGNGKGGNAGRNGSNATVYEFDESGRGLAGGGGGGGAEYGKDHPGGQPCGGTGVNDGGKSGKVPGGGGGGGFYNGGPGGAGQVSIRW